MKYEICLSCGSKCCRRFDYRTWYVQLTLRDIVRISKGLNKSVDEIIGKYIIVLTNMYPPLITLKVIDKRCIFLTDRGCSIQSFKPIACRTYPVYIPGTYIDPDCPLSRFPELLEEEEKYVRQYIEEFNETMKILENEHIESEYDLIRIVRKYMLDREQVT